MKKTFKGWLYNRIERLGGESFNHVGCKGKDENFIDFLTQFVPEVGMQRKVKFIIEAEGEPEIIASYRLGRNYQKEYNKKRQGKNKK